MKRRHFAIGLPASAALSTLPLALAAPARAQAARKRTVTLGMALEPPGLDPTTGAASSIAEIVLYNVLETLTKINPDGSVAPLLAERWSVSPDLRAITFFLRQGVRFQNGEPLNAQCVKYSFERAAHANSTNKDRRTFAAMESIQTPNAHAVVIINREPDPDFLFYMGQATAAIVEPESAANNNTTPVGTGPYTFETWRRGASLTLKAWPDFRNASAIAIERATFRFISDAAAQAAALLSGDVDGFARISERSVARFKNNPRYQIIVAGSRAKTVLAINHARKPLNDVRVRRAIAAAIDRKAVIEGAQSGYGVPIGSHYVPDAPGYVDTTDINPYNPEKARALLREAGITTPLTLTLTLPPAAYARQGGEIIISELAKIGIVAKAQNVEWAQWLSGTHTDRNYDLSIISHVEPFDLGNFAQSYYWNYRNPQFDALYAKIKTTADLAERNRLLGHAQRLLAQDAALVWLYQPQWVSVADKRLRGLWRSMPIFVNDLSALSWD
ncbi:MAG: ABC transporter substrate-binding protein [Burkholderiaceae bacterium]|jgi:peptide/nickel transport system substrate-binding protein|nr:ABC transporter substrate-binding protein [Burkholderiaceae bacterium]